MRKLSISLIILCLMLSAPCLGRAQQLIFSPPAQEWRETGLWTSPVFEASKDTRVEWNAYPQPDADAPTFRFFVITEANQKQDERKGLTGLGFLDAGMIQVEVHTEQIGAWEIRLFNLKAPPVSSTNSPVTTSIPPVLTTQIQERTVTIAVYTTLPPAMYLVPFSYFVLGALTVTGGFVGVLVVLALKNYDLLLAKKTPPKEPDE